MTLHQPHSVTGLNIQSGLPFYSHVTCNCWSPPVGNWVAHSILQHRKLDERVTAVQLYTNCQGRHGGVKEEVRGRIDKREGGLEA